MGIGLWCCSAATAEEGQGTKPKQCERRGLGDGNPSAIGVVDAAYMGRRWEWAVSPSGSTKEIERIGRQ